MDIWVVIMLIGGSHRRLMAQFDPGIVKNIIACQDTHRTSLMVNQNDQQVAMRMEKVLFCATLYYVTHVVGVLAFCHSQATNFAGGLLYCEMVVVK